MTKDNQTKCFKALPGYFKAYESKDSHGIDSTEENPVELIKHESWKELYESLPEDTDKYHYKLVILGRHGQGYHNAAILRYGMEEWNRYWSLLDGDEHGSWLDSKLTPLGKKQVKETGTKIYTPIVQHLETFPHVFFSSPMRRCLETFIGSWTPNFCNFGQLIPDTTIPVKIIEDLRETLGEHTCDKRVSYYEVTSEYQNFKTDSGHTVQWLFEPDYPENDQMWQAKHRETIPEMDQRIARGLTKMFKQVKPEEKIVSLTCHSGVIHSTLRNIGHPPVNNLNTGGVVCSVVRLDVDQLGKL